jgi:NADH-quinone oxidoreductase subunit N
VAIVVGSAISLAYYLRVVAAVWMRDPGEAPEPAAAPAGRPAIAGGAPEADAEPARVPRVQLEVLAVAVVCAVATIFFGIWPDPLFDLARDAGSAFTGLV